MQLAKVKEETKEKKPKRTKQKKVKGPKKLDEEEKPHEGDLEEVGFFHPNAFDNIVVNLPNKIIIS